MAGKMSKLVIKVDLSCHHCYKKIQKTLCKLQERCKNIKTISYDEKNNTVTVCGPFDPKKLSKKIRCKACKVIIEIITVDCTPPPPPPTPPPPTPAPPPPPCCKVINDIQIIVCGQCKDSKYSDSTVVKKVTEKPATEKTKEQASKEDSKKKKEETTKKEPYKVINDIDIVVCGHPKDSKCPEPPPNPVPCHPMPNPVPCQPLVRPDCCYMPCFVECHGGSRCCSCGKVYGFVGGPPICCGGTSRGGYQLICREEDPSNSCTFM